MFTSMDSFSLMAVPFFMLAGTLMEKSGITKILVNWARSLVGHCTGGIGDAAIVSGVVMAGVSGSANADTSALERDFGFRPSTSLRQGLRKFARWYKEFYMNGQE